MRMKIWTIQIGSFIFERKAHFSSLKANDKLASVAKGTYEFLQHIGLNFTEKKITPATHITELEVSVRLEWFRVRLIITYIEDI